MEDELLDLVNAHDEVIGTILRSESHRLFDKRDAYVRAVEAFIQNDEGKLWIPKRTAYKQIAPNGLDYSMGGHVESGETYLASALREIKEELNISLKPTDLQFVQKFQPGLIPYFRVLYIYRSNVTPNYNPRDFVSAEWLTPTELMAKLDAGVPAKNILREAVQALLQR